MHLIRFGLFNFEIWFVFGLDIEILADSKVDKNFNIRTFGGVFRYFELAVYLKMTLIL